MQLNNSLRTFCVFSVLSLSLISCTEKDSNQKSSAWGLREPVIITANNESVKFSEASTKFGLKYTATDDLLLNVYDSNVQLASLTTCFRGEERIQSAKKIVARREMKLMEFIPEELLFSKSATPLKDVTCNLEITATHSSGARHIFPVLNLPMADGTKNDIELTQDMSVLKKTDDKAPIVHLNEFDEVRFARLNPGEEYFLKCETFTASTTQAKAQNLADLTVDSGSLPEKGTPTQLCRLMKTANKHVFATSEFFRLQSLNVNELIVSSDLAPELKITSAFIFSGDITYHKETWQNVTSSPIRIQVSKVIPVTMSVTHQHQRVNVPDWKLDLKSSFAGVHAQDLGQSLEVELQPGASVQIAANLNAYISCTRPMISVKADSQGVRGKITVLTMAGNLIIERPWLPESLGLIGWPNLPSRGQDGPAGCITRLMGVGF